MPPEWRPHIWLPPFGASPPRSGSQICEKPGSLSSPTIATCYCNSGKVFFREKREAIGKILRQLCEWKRVEIHEAEICPDHVHMLVSIPPKVSVSGFMGYLKGKSSLMIYGQFGNLKYKYRGREFWCRGYYVDTVGKNKQKIAEYIRHQLDEDKLGEQMTMFGKDDDPFKGSK